MHHNQDGITRINCQQGRAVSPGDTLLWLEAGDDKPETS
ncbi:urea carboxylase [Xenorhabdus hominickii]|uniref:Urea carboxylase n=1 Tax=Xenorhabdus hominickii TaxID=351679 RepID=A0A2G0QG65_XENHO|nr:urea carboxylase [Xenorhabdus hominickii]